MARKPGWYSNYNFTAMQYWDESGPTDHTAPIPAGTSNGHQIAAQLRAMSRREQKRYLRAAYGYLVRELNRNGVFEELTTVGSFTAMSYAELESVISGGAYDEPRLREAVEILVNAGV